MILGVQRIILMSQQLNSTTGSSLKTDADGKILMGTYHFSGARFYPKSSDTGDSGLSCRNSAGKMIEHGNKFTILRANKCALCTCAGGKSRRCISVQCAKPTCNNYRTVAGKCCEYTCPDALPISDTKQLAIILSLSISLLIILILIIIVWRRTRKYKRYASNIRTECTSVEQEALDSIPNNQRQSSNITPSTSSRTTVQLTSQEPPPYAPPKKPDPETITPCEPPPPYTPQDITYV